MNEPQELTKEQRNGIRILLALLAVAALTSLGAVYNTIPTSATNTFGNVHSTFKNHSMKLKTEAEKSGWNANSKVTGYISASEGGTVVIFSDKTDGTHKYTISKSRYIPDGEILVSGTLASYKMKLRVEGEIIAVYDSKTEETDSLLQTGTWSELPVIP